MIVRGVDEEVEGMLYAYDAAEVAREALGRLESE